MTDSKELYKKLSADFKAEKNYYFSDLGEGMMQGVNMVRAAYSS